MSPRIRTTIIACAAAAPLAACGAKTTTLTLRVTTDAGEAVPLAHIMATAIGTSDIPLPVTMQRLKESAASTWLSGTTDDRGEVRLRVLADRVQFVQVIPPPTNVLAINESIDRMDNWYWYLDVDPIRLSEPEETPNPPGIALHLISPAPRPE